MCKAWAIKILHKAITSVFIRVLTLFIKMCMPHLLFLKPHVTVLGDNADVTTGRLITKYLDACLADFGGLFGEYDTYFTNSF